MDSDTAYARDVLAGGETFISNATDGEIWGVEFELPGDTAIVPGGPIEFHESYNERENCFVSSGFISCGSRSILIRWSLTVQGQTTGEWDIRFTNNDIPYETKSFYLKPQIPPGKVPAGSEFNQGTYSTTPYDGICKGPQKPNGKYKSVPCDTTYTDPFTIQNKGCYLTAGAMILAYHGVDVDVEELNTWLSNNEGYSSKGGVIPPKIAEYAQEEKEVDISFRGWYSTTDDETLEDLIYRFGPQMIGTKLNKDGNPGHFVTAFGKDITETTFLINDPDGGVKTSIKEKYSNNWSGIRAFSGPGYTVTNNSYMSVRFYSPGELVLTNPEGKRIGLDPTTNTSYDEIPRAVYGEQGLVNDSQPTVELDNDPSYFHEIEIIQPADGDYKLEVIGTGTGTYSLDIITMGTNFDNAMQTFTDIPISPGMIHNYQFSYSQDAATNITIEGGYDGAGQRPRDVNKFLSYASPSEAQTTLPQGTTSYTLHVFYGESIVPGSFSAELNRRDITGQFNPQPGTYEMVNLSLTPGRNVIVLSVDGLLPNSRAANDKDRLVLKVD